MLSLTDCPKFTQLYDFPPIDPTLDSTTLTLPLPLPYPYHALSLTYSTLPYGWDRSGLNMESEALL